jgi:excisionase family DNA binding protein
MPKKLRTKSSAPVVKPMMVSIAVAAALIGCVRLTIRNYIKAGYLRSSKVGRRVYISVADIEKMMADHAVVQ